MKQVLFLILMFSVIGFAGDKKKDVKAVANDSTLQMQTNNLVENFNSQIVNAQEDLKKENDKVKNLESKIIYLTGQRDLLLLLKKDNDSLTVRIK